MAFWSPETLKERVPDESLIEPYSAESVSAGAYELSLGSEVFLTSDDDGTKDYINDHGQIQIPPGQFGLLITEEMIRVPHDAIAFISIKAGIKFRGLVNVSGFHVDPGFTGRLKFSVFNAGGRAVVLQRSQKVFLIWYADLDRKTEFPYAGNHQNQMHITPDDVMRIQGDIPSPTSLQRRISNLEIQFKAWAGVVVGILVALLLTQLKGCSEDKKPKTTTEKPESREGSRSNAISADSEPTGPPDQPTSAQNTAEPAAN